jgi:hypothetical protein
MSPIYLYNGKLLVVDGKLATGQACCCAGGCNCTCDDDYVFSVVIEGQTLSVDSVNTVARQELCLECEDGPPVPGTIKCTDVPGRSSLGSTARDVDLDYNSVTVDEDGCLFIDVVVATCVGDGQLDCDTLCVRTFTYKLPPCDASGCPNGEAALVNTVDLLGYCEEECDCCAITAPTSVTATSPTCCEFP